MTWDYVDKCIFRQKWWLEAVHDRDEWGEVRIELSPEKYAVLPYIIKKKYGFKMLTMPPLTQVGGPFLNGVKFKNNRKLGLEKDLHNKLIDNLPDFDFFSQNFHWAVINWLPWYWQGFQQTTRYTYRIEDLSNLELVYSKFLSGIKGDIKKASNRFNLRIHSDYDVNRFIDINEKTFERQDLKLPYTRELVRSLDAACNARNCRKIFFAEDNEGKIHAAIYIVWDEYSAYYLMGGGDPELRNSGATSLAMWEAIKFSSTVTKSFDFEGSMIESVERFFRGFGGTPVPYFNITKINSRSLKILCFLKSLV